MSLLRYLNVLPFAHTGVGPSEYRSRSFILSWSSPFRCAASCSNSLASRRREKRDGDAMAITIRLPPTSAHPRERMGDGTTSTSKVPRIRMARKPRSKNLRRSDVTYPVRFRIRSWVPRPEGDARFTAKPEPRLAGGVWGKAPSLSTVAAMPPALLGSSRVSSPVGVAPTPTAVAMLPAAPLRVPTVRTPTMPAPSVPHHAGVSPMMPALVATEPATSTVPQHAGVSTVTTVATMGLSTTATESGHDGLLVGR